MTSRGSDHPEKMRVLAIDDDQTTTKLYAHLLGEMGHDVVITATAAETLEAVKKEYFDLVILDLKLPDMHGSELLEKMKDDIHDAPVIIVTGNPSLESSIDAIRSGIVYDYITKPFGQKDFELVVRRAVEKVTLSLENKRLLRKLEKINQALLERVDELEKASGLLADYNGKISKMTDRINKLEKNSSNKGDAPEGGRGSL